MGGVPGKARFSPASRRPRRSSAAAASSSSSTTRTARTRATWRSPPRRSRPDAINFMATHARGLICLALTEERCDELQLPPMVEHNTSPHQTAFCVSIEARHRTTTGISAADRAATVLTRHRPRDPPGRPAAARATRSRCAPGTAACSSAPGTPRPRSTSRGSPGLYPAAVICEVMDADGSMARLPRLLEVAREHGIWRSSPSAT